MIERTPTWRNHFRHHERRANIHQARLNLGDARLSLRHLARAVQ